jgi:hypothetical protein
MTGFAVTVAAVAAGIASRVVRARLVELEEEFESEFGHMPAGHSPGQ